MNTIKLDVNQYNIDRRVAKMIRLWKNQRRAEIVQFHWNKRANGEAVVGLTLDNNDPFLSDRLFNNLCNDRAWNRMLEMNNIKRYEDIEPAFTDPEVVWVNQARKNA